MAERKTVSVVLPIWVYKILEEYAEEKDWSVSQAARNMIMDSLCLNETGDQTKSKKK